MNKKLRAFTLLEMSVVIILSTIVIALGFQVFDYAKKLFSKFERQEINVQKDVSSIYNMERLFRNSSFIVRERNKLLFYFSNEEVKAIELFDSYILSSEVFDTLLIQSYDVHMFHLNRGERFSLVSGLLIRLDNNPKKGSYFFEKTYSSSQAIQYENRYKER